MNGINTNLFFGDSLFNTNRNKEVDGQKTTTGKVTTYGEYKAKSKTQSVIQDTVEITGESRQVKQAGYSKPKMKVQKEESEQPKALDKNGVQEGVELSDKAKKLLASLKEKYGNMDFYVASTNSDEEEAYYMNQGQKEYSVLINPETLESMAADEKVREKYENILDGTKERFEDIKKEIGEEDMEYVGTLHISFGKDDTVSYVAEILDVMKSDKNKTQNGKTTKVKASSAKELAEKIKESIAEKKKLKEEQLKKEEEKKQEKE